VAGWYAFHTDTEVTETLRVGLKSLAGPKVIKSNQRIVAPTNCAWLTENWLRGQGITFTVQPPKPDRPPFTRSDLLALTDFRVQPAGMEKPWPDYPLEYQSEAIFFGGHLPGMHLWHAPGAGKTITAIIWGCLYPGTIVFVTRAAARGTIAQEIRRVTVHEPLVLQGLKPQPIPYGTRFVVVAWENLVHHLPVILAANPVSVIWDEAHKGSSPKRWVAEPAKDDETGEVMLDPQGNMRLNFKKRENRSSAAADLAQAAKRRLATTATPIKDRIRDLWAQLDLVEPRQWGSFMDWARRYCAAKDNPYGGIDTSGRASEPFLKELLARLSFCVHSVPFSRTHKDLPPLRRTATYLGPESLLTGREVSVATTEKKLKGSSYNLGHREAVLFHKLRTAADKKRPAAVERVLQTACSVPGEDRGGKVVVFTALREDCEKFHAALKKAGGPKLTSWMAHGEHSTNLRDRIRDEYMSHPGPCVLVGTGDAWGESVNLQDTDLALVVMLPWTPAQIRQWEGRFKRRGMLRPCLMEYMIAASTADEHVAQLLIEKLPAVERVVADEELAGFAKVIGGTADEEKVLEGLLATVLGAEVDERELNEEMR
jgi:hypothetical protein